MAYSADGETILAAGKSKNVCIYHVKEGILLKKFEITQNHSLDGLDVRICEASFAIECVCTWHSLFIFCTFLGIHKSSQFDWVR